MIEGRDDTRHHTLMHVDRHEVVERTMSSCCAAVGDLDQVKDKRFCLMTVSVRVEFGSKEVLTYSLLDSGSKRTFCVRDSKVGARGSRRRLPIKTLSSGTSVDEFDEELISITVIEMSDNRNLELAWPKLS